MAESGLSPVRPTVSTITIDGLAKRAAGLLRRQRHEGQVVKSLKTPRVVVVLASRRPVAVESQTSSGEKRRRRHLLVPINPANRAVGRLVGRQVGH